MNAGLRRAILSVTDKRGLVELAEALVAGDVQLFASGGTARHLGDAGLEVSAVEELTHFPEILAGRVKTLHPGVLAGVLADKSNAEHRADLEEHELAEIDLVVVNFYAFENAARQETMPLEAIDIGGPTLVRAAAKNFDSVVILTHPSDYREFLAAWQQGGLNVELRRSLAARAFERVAEYDRIIADRFTSAAGGAPPTAPTRTTLRYGENPHQTGEALLEQPPWGLGTLQQSSGEALSYNNLVDADAALDLVYDLGKRPACAIIKHNNACGAALGSTARGAFSAALACDPVSAFGGVVAFNCSVDADVADALSGHFFEVLCAPSVSAVAREMLQQKKKRLRVLEVSRQTWCPQKHSRAERRLHGITLIQDRDHGFDELAHLEVVTQRQPTPDEREDAVFLWSVAKHVRSNAIVIGSGRRTLGIGAGQMSRVDSCEIAVHKAGGAGHDLMGSVAASDAFFPFPDGVERLAEAGVRVVVQPGGSKRDAEVVSAADRLGITMLFTGRRHFRH
jgi:phosphoribosylaminoimidazolecarboxamide formyltransferase/IMP cyclohydrolase